MEHPGPGRQRELAQYGLPNRVDYRKTSGGIGIEIKAIPRDCITRAWRHSRIVDLPWTLIDTIERGTGVPLVAKGCDVRIGQQFREVPRAHFLRRHREQHIFSLLKPVP